MIPSADLFRSFLLLYFPVFFSLPALAKDSPLQIINPVCEHASDPLGLEVPVPRLGWKLRDPLPTDRGQVQTAYRILVASSPGALAAGKGDLWDSGKVASDESVFVSYAGKKLTEDEVCFWKVQVWDRDGKSSAWSETAFWTMGLFSNHSWKAQWISAATPWTDYVIETHCHVVSGGVAVAFRVGGAADGYLWYFDAAQHLLKPSIRGGEKGPAWKPVPFNADLTSGDHDLRMQVAGPVIQTFLDDQPIDKRTDTSYASGGIGFRAQMGIRPLEPGFAKILIEPHSGTMKWAEMKVPTVKGELIVRFDNKGAYRLSVDLPTGMTARMGLPIAAPNAAATIMLDGQAMRGEVIQGTAFLDNVGSGKHTVTL